jgi:hypothetical protein
MKNLDVPYYSDYLSPKLFERLKSERTEVPGVSGLTQIGQTGGLETPEALRFLCELYEATKSHLNEVLNQRKLDREFIDQRTKACFELNQNLGIDFLDPSYETLIGQEDAKGRIVIGPKNEYYCKSGHGKPIATIPKFLAGNHVTLFGPPDDAKLSRNYF